VRVRVLMISKALVVGAYQRKLELLASAPDVDVTCVVPPAWGAQHLERAYLRGYRLEVQPIRFNGNFHLFHFPRLARVLREIRPDVVHIDEEPYNLATFLALRQALGVGARPLFFTWQNLNRAYPPPFRWMERYVFRHVRYAIAGNADAVGVLRAKGYGGPAAVIPQFGVDPELFTPAAKRTPDADQPLTIGFAGRLVEEKGLYTLFDALDGLDGEWRLRLQGDGPLREPLRARAQQLGMSERVIFDKSAPSTEMPARLAAFDVLVLPSLTTPRWKEQFGRVLQEAMALGVPVIGSSSGEIPSVIGDAGIVFPEGDAVSLRWALERLAASPGLRAELGRRGRGRVLAHFTHGRIAEQTLDVYRKMTNG
jgi:glycosyltransferase involved in cell wall biosynthesis